MLYRHIARLRAMANKRRICHLRLLVEKPCRVTITDFKGGGEVKASSLFEAVAQAVKRAAFISRCIESVLGMVADRQRNGEHEFRTDHITSRLSLRSVWPSIYFSKRTIPNASLSESSSSRTRREKGRRHDGMTHQRATGATG